MSSTPPLEVWQQVHLDQHDELIQIEATARGRPVEDGGYLWRGELKEQDAPSSR